MRTPAIVTDRRQVLRPVASSVHGEHFGDHGSSALPLTQSHELISRHLRVVALDRGRSLPSHRPHADDPAPTRSLSSSPSPSSLHTRATRTGSHRPEPPFHAPQETTAKIRSLVKSGMETSKCRSPPPTSPGRPRALSALTNSLAPEMPIIEESLNLDMQAGQAYAFLNGDPSPAPVHGLVGLHGAEQPV